MNHNLLLNSVSSLINVLIISIEKDKKAKLGSERCSEKRMENHIIILAKDSLK